MIAAIGQDSHRFEEKEGKPLILGGVLFDEETRGLDANSDGDVVLHALTNAISGLSARNVLGKAADGLCRQGITDSRAYVKEALKDLKQPVRHVSFSIECAHPKISPRIPAMRREIAGLLGLEEDSVGITATTGEGLTDFGRGLGISVLCIISAGD